MTTQDVATDDPRAALRQAIYVMLIGLAAAVSIGRIFTAGLPRHNTPFLSANDRSRWSTVAALVDHGTFAIDEVIFREDGKRNGDWYSIDIVRHRGRDGTEHYYSSKPPLFSVLLAGEYWLVKMATGASLQDQPYYVARIMLVLTNVLPFTLALWLLSRVVEKRGTSDWGRTFVVAAAAFGTYLTTLNVTLNNHTIAAASVMVATYFAWKIWDADTLRTSWFAGAGFFAAFATANELPALSFLALLAVALFWKSWKQTIGAFVPAAGIVMLAALLTNYVAHDSWRPPYAHRNKDGAPIARLTADAQRDLEQLNVSAKIKERVLAAGWELSDNTTLEPRAGSERWVLFDRVNQHRFAIAGVADGYEIRLWDDWYDFEGSYWSPGKQQGVDRGEESRLTYAFNMLVGHHGVFSLTPIWALTVLGIGMSFIQRDRLSSGFALLVVTLTVVCAVFYVGRPLIDRNYGGVSCGFRWLFWLIPLWLVAMIPACDRLATSRIGQWFAWITLAISAFSAAYSANNPWSHPWLFEYWKTLGWISY